MNKRILAYLPEPSGPNGKAILVRFIWPKTDTNSPHFEQSFSEDGGKTWEVNWITDQKRANDDASSTSVQQSSAKRDGQGDFDFEIGTWKTHLKLSSRLRHPFTGPNTWTEYEGTSVVRKIWNGRANMVELEVDGPSGHVEGLNLRLYNPESHQWSLNFANSKVGAMSVPTVGEFKNGRGEFYDQEAINGRVILVRNVWSDITPSSCHFEQAFSDDGGKTWEVNWIADDSRGGNEPDKPQ